MPGNLTLKLGGRTEQLKIEIAGSGMVLDDVLEASDQTNDMEMPSEISSEVKKLA